MNDLIAREPVKARIPYHPRLSDTYGITDHVWKTLVDVLYPTAENHATVALILSACAAKGLDPLEKPFHIVPMWSSRAKRYVDQVWPSLNLYRTQAARTGEYAGIDEPVFGPVVEREFVGLKKNERGQKVSWSVTVRFPEWVKVTVYRMVHGQRCAFASPEIEWLEFYSRRGFGNELPTDSWIHRPRFMPQKVAESQALRRAFPELCEQPTADEMDAVRHEPRDITPPVEVVETDHHAEGFQAFLDEKQPSDCPYDVDDFDQTHAYNAWISGYLAAEKEALDE